MKWLMAGLFLVSGATALVGEVVWMRMLGLVLGNTVWAAATTATVWMAGMAVGSRLGAWLAPRTSSHLRWYGVAEGAIGIFYAVSPSLHSLLLDSGARLGEDMGQSLALGVIQRFALAALTLAIPTVLMGVTLPLLVECIRGTDLASRVSLLYGINTLGAAAGVFTAAYLTLPVLGEAASLAVAGMACALVGAIAICADFRARPPSPAAPAPQGVESSAKWFLVLVAVMGASALAAEMIWVRILVLRLGSRVYAFALLLGVYLLGVAIGSLVIWFLAKRISNPGQALARIQLLAAAALTLQVLALGYTGKIISALTSVIPIGMGFFWVQALFFVGVVLLFLPVTVLFGASFPIAVAADPSRRSAGAHAGVVASANTLGCIVGALGAPFLLVPLIGCQRSVLLLVLAHVGVALVLNRKKLMVVAAVIVLGCAAVVSVALPGDWILRRTSGGGEAGIELVKIDETLTATVLVKRYQEEQGTWLSLELNGVNVAGTTPGLLAVQQLQGHLPLLQVAQPRRALHVGFGSGGTCWALSRYPVEQIDVVEISPEVLENSDTYFSEINHHVLSDPRVRVVVNDGRNYLLATDATYDAILSDSIHPVYAGNSTLYTVEYFRLCREHLNPGGVVSMWLPLYSLDQESYLRILAAFHEVFPRTVVWYDTSSFNEFTVVTGQVEPGPVKIYWDRLLWPELADSLAIAGVEDASDIMSNLLLGPPEVDVMLYGVPAHEDDLPFVEYTAGRVLARQRTWFENLRMLGQSRARVSPLVQDPAPWEMAVRERDAHLRSCLDGLMEKLRAELRESEE